MTKPDSLFAIVRVDLFLLENGRLRPDQDWNSLVTVKAVLDNVEKAKAEVARLNALNDGKGCLYFWQATRRDGGEPSS
jgi:hypothetical protein